MRKRNDKGFSLVELIVVIAIMAVLVGILAPAYLKYVEKAREAADLSAFDEAINTMDSISLDAFTTWNTNKTVEVEFDSNTVTFGGTALDASDIVKEIMSNYQIKSKRFCEGVIITGTKQTDDTMKYSMTGGSGMIAKEEYNKLHPGRIE